MNKLYNDWPDLTNTETVCTILAVGVVVFILLRWACKRD